MGKIVRAKIELLMRKWATLKLPLVLVDGRVLWLWVCWHRALSSSPPISQVPHFNKGQSYQLALLLWTIDRQWVLYHSKQMFCFKALLNTLYHCVLQKLEKSTGLMGLWAWKQILPNHQLLVCGRLIYVVKKITVILLAFKFRSLF